MSGLNNALNPATDIGIGTITRYGAHASSRRPFYRNTLGIDQDRFRLGAYLDNGDTQGQFRIGGSTGETNQFLCHLL